MFRKRRFLMTDDSRNSHIIVLFESRLLQLLELLILKYIPPIRISERGRSHAGVSGLIGR